MKFLVVLAVAVACASADVSHVVKDSDFNAPIVKSSYDISPEGNFQYSYETGNGIAAESQGVLKNQNSEYPSLEISGAYRYDSPDGPISLTYFAGDSGFEAQGSHLPTPPPTPEAILRGLAWIEAHPPPADGLKVVPKPAYG